MHAERVGDRRDVDALLPAVPLEAAQHDGLQRRLDYGHVLHREVVSDTGRPLYYLVFASDSDVGEKIMRSEFGASHTEQAQLFNTAEFTPGLVYDPDRERNYRR